MVISAAAKNRQKKKKLHRYIIGIEPARMVCHTDSSRCERRRSRAEHEAKTGQKKVRKASKATPTRNPPITIHIIHLVSAIPPPYCYFIPYLKNFS